MDVRAWLQPGDRANRQFYQSRRVAACRAAGAERIRQEAGERAGRGLVRTQGSPGGAEVEGKILLQRAERIFAEIDSAINEIADSAELRSGAIRVGMPPMYGLVYFPRLLAQFHSAYPGITMTVIEGAPTKSDGCSTPEASTSRCWKRAASTRNGARWSWARRKWSVRCDRSIGGARIGARSRARQATDGPVQRELHPARHFRQALQEGRSEAGHRLAIQLGRVDTQSGGGRAGRRDTARGHWPRRRRRWWRSRPEPREILRFSLCWRDDRYLSKANPRSSSWRRRPDRRAKGLADHAPGCDCNLATTPVLSRGEMKIVKRWLLLPLAAALAALHLAAHAASSRSARLPSSCRFRPAAEPT